MGELQSTALTSQYITLRDCWLPETRLLGLEWWPFQGQRAIPRSPAGSPQDVLGSVQARPDTNGGPWGYATYGRCVVIKCTNTTKALWHSQSVNTLTNAGRCFSTPGPPVPMALRSVLSLLMALLAPWIQLSFSSPGLPVPPVTLPWAGYLSSNHFLYFEEPLFS